MMKIWKRMLALALCVLMILGCFTACGGGEQKPAETTEPVATVDPEEEKTLKVLTLGHSLAVDAAYMLSLVAAAEGYEDMVVSTLYYSGCPLYRHVEYLTNNSAEYILYSTSTKTANEPPAALENVTMQYALELDYWDVIIMQGGTFEVGEKTTYTVGHIQTIQNYVNEHKKNPDAVFMWHMPWAFATEEGLQLMYTHSTPEKNPYINGYKNYDNDRLKFYEAFTKHVADFIMTDETFTKLLPTGTAVENALTSYMTEWDLIRDYAHVTDYGRLLAAYTWFCVLTGVEQLEEVKLDAIPRKFFKSNLGANDRVLTDTEKAIIVESVNNALKNPLQVTQSQYTEAPKQ